jgi:hypothetical protein
MPLARRVRLFTAFPALSALVATAGMIRCSDRPSRAEVRRLQETREVWETFQADRYEKLKLGVRVLGNDPAFKAAITTDQATVFDMLRERGQDLRADFFIATDPSGIVIARSDRPRAQGEDLSGDPVVSKPLEGQEASAVWRQGDKLYHVVSVPMSFGMDLVGVLIAGYGIDQALADCIARISRYKVAFLVGVPGQAPRLVVSSLGPRDGALKAVLEKPEFAFPASETYEVDLAGERHIGFLFRLRSPAAGPPDSVVFLRNLAE